ncbi:MAG: transposase, partial [Nitrososphaerota archaeon]|nr:transposase [Nitrososphaerota archaeon]
MKNIPQPIQTTYQQIKQQQNTRLELRNIKNHYYIYKAQNHYNKQTKQSTKTTQLIGKITPDGTYHPKKPKTKTPTTKIYEYANTQLLQTLSQDIQQTKTNIPHKQELIALSIIRATHPSPIRLTQTIWNNLYPSTKTNLNLTPKNTTTILKNIGTQIEETYDLFHDLTPQGGMLFYDLTSILSNSKRLLLAERGYNPDWEQSGQIRVALAFSTTTHLPVAVDVFYGSLKEVKILNYFKEHFKGTDLGFIMDRGFNSYELLLELKAAGIHYVVPLMKNSQFLPPSIQLTGMFEYGGKRVIGCAKVGCGEYGFLYLFKDPSLGKVADEFLMRQVYRGKLSLEEYYLEQRLAGVFGVLSDLDVEPRVVFEQYKAREEIEQAFDYMKNDLEADKTCLGCDEAVRGYFVVVFLAMRLYFKILMRLRERGLVGVVSVREVLYVLSKMQMVVEVGGREYLCALPKKTEEIYEVFSDLIKM